MARSRNPRFCPEFLERKLSPSGLLAPTAQVSLLDDPEPAPSPTDPGLPPTTPTTPTGPVTPY